MDAVSAAPWWLQASVAAAVFAYLPSYWSFKELAPGGDCRRGFQCWAGWRAVASFLFGECIFWSEIKMCYNQQKNSWPFDPKLKFPPHPTPN